MNDIIKILFIGGVFDEKSELEVLASTKGYAELSANIFQKKLLKGFEKNNVDVTVLSAPFIGAFPMGYKRIRFKGFDNSQSEYKYVRFNNIWGIRNFSRAHSLKRTINSYKKNGKSFDLIIVYSAHTPFLKAGVYAKKLFQGSRICYVVPDLPQYMNLSEHRSSVYDFFKKFDIKKMDKLSNAVDSFVILTEPMKDALNVGDRPYAVIEGIVESIGEIDTTEKADTVKNIVYTGKMNAKFGIKELVDAFMRIENKDYRLVLCGDGDAREYVLEKSAIDNRIEYKGQVPHVEAKKWIARADVLVNPRPNNEEYTKYSFPSKNIEYLNSGNPVVAYLLDGMPREYGEFIFIVKNGDISSAIKSALDCEDYVKRYENFVNYASQKLTSDKVADTILKMNFDKMESRHENDI